MFYYMYEVACLWAHNVFRMVRHPNGFHVDKVLVFDESDHPVTMYEHAPVNMSVKQLREYFSRRIPDRVSVCFPRAEIQVCSPRA